MSEHEQQLLGAYALGTVDPDERRSIEAHLAACAACRAELDELEEVKVMLDAVPPEAMLEGPPGADHVLDATLAKMRASERSDSLRRRMFTLAAAFVAIAAVAVGGVLAGRATAPGTDALPPPPGVTVPPPVEGTRSGTTVDATTGARLTASVIPADGWVRVTTAVNGIPEGELCRIEVLGADGKVEVAGSWRVSAKGAADGTTLDGAAIIPPDEVSAVRIVNTDGKVFVSLAF